MRLAWISPLEVDLVGMHSHSAYFSRMLLPEIALHADVELFRNAFTPHPTLPSHHYLTLVARHAERPFDLLLYQIDAHPLNRWSRVAVGLMPGVVLFHDFVFRDFGPEPVLNSAWRHHVERFKDAATPWPAREGEYTQQGPFGFREAAWGIACGFSSARLHDEYRRNVTLSLSREGSIVRSFYLPFPVPPASAQERERGSSDRLHICFDGSVRPEHRAHMLLLALKQTQCPVHCEWLVDPEELSQAQHLCEEFGVGDRVSLHSPRTAERWQNLLLHADAACHLAFTAYDQLGPFCSMSLTSGASVVVLDYGDAFYLPENAVWKISPGEYEHMELACVFDELWGERRAMPSQELAFLRALHDPRAVAKELLAAVAQYREVQRSMLALWHDIRSQAREKLFDEAAELAAADAEKCVRDLLVGSWRELGWMNT